MQNGNAAFGQVYLNCGRGETRAKDRPGPSVSASARGSLKNKNWGYRDSLCVWDTTGVAAADPGSRRRLIPARGAGLSPGTLNSASGLMFAEEKI